MHSSCSFIIGKAEAGDAEAASFALSCSNGKGCHLWKECRRSVEPHAHSQEHLTPRQRDVLACMFRGEGSNKHIARLLGISESTVKIHMSQVMRKMKASNRTQAVLNAQRLGIL